MIISFLSGGLGNQMFQFAAGRALALRHGRQYRIDPSYYDMYRQNRVYELGDVFKFSFDIAAPSDIKAVLGIKRLLHQHPVLRRIYRRLPGTGNWIVEPHYHFWPELLQIRHSCLLEGDWQSPRYFTDFAEQIRDCFQFKTDSFKDSETLQTLQNCNSVALHLRRADYVSNAHTLSWHGVCEADYYLAAIRHIRSRVTDARFFVFSDDHGAAREVLAPESGLVFVDNLQSGKNHFDMMLMSSCKHNIIANSTFSWWAAWLNRHRDKIVVAPQRWFATTKLSDRDLIPQNWIRL